MDTISLMTMRLLAARSGGTVYAAARFKQGLAATSALWPVATLREIAQ